MLVAVKLKFVQVDKMAIFWTIIITGLYGLTYYFEVLWLFGPVLLGLNRCDEDHRSS